MSSEAPQANPKVVVGVLAVLSFSALVLGAFQIMNTIRGPFVQPAAEEEDAAQLALAEDDKLKRQDTDQDGLSDFDELVTYNTSPFLKDSDSDGTEDRIEINQGQDPNCPVGRVCGLVVNGNTNDNTNGSLAANANGSVPSLLTGSNIEALRQTLKDAGAPAYIIDNTDDATLLRTYQSIIGDDSNTNTNAGTFNDQELLGSLKDLKPAEIRDLLKQGGADEAVLKDIDDGTLLDIFKRAIDEENNLPSP